jgi:pSer/pThr/pTyr-binding forkhead associated (FHA) protein
VLPQNEVIRLHVLEGTHPGARFDLSKPLMTIGRIGGGADIEIEDPEVSRLHCSIEVRRDAILLQDMHSKNGTFMGDARVFTARLRADSEFRIGATVLRVDRVAI